jgi:hydrogenase expression/formation protein HypE
MHLKLGKLPPDVLEKYVLGLTGASSKDFVLPPGIGLDFGVVRFTGGFLIVSSDPITGVDKNIGSYAVVVSSNDVATSGNRARFMQSVVLLPENARKSDVKRLAMQMHGAATDLGITLVGGHTELTPGLSRPIVITTAFAFATDYVSANQAQEGDILLLTKTAGIEGTRILSSGRYGEIVLRKLGISPTKVDILKELSVVEEAVVAFKTKAVSAMHDCTEGGVLGACYEMSVASGIGVEIWNDKVPVSDRTEAICGAFGIDPLKLISSGALLIAVNERKVARVRMALQSHGVAATPIGRLGGKSRILLTNGSEEAIDTAPTDEIWRIEERLNREKTT